jgi:hypothetical protein
MWHRQFGFKVEMQMGGNSMSSDYAGTVSGNEMKLKISPYLILTPVT